VQFPPPHAFHSELSDERLSVIAAKLLDVRYMTIRQMDTEYDDNYTRECPVYGRSRKMLIALAQSKQFPWLTVKCMGMGVKISIGNVPCKFFRDDVENPEKEGFFRQESFECLFEESDDVPVLWRFVIERALTEDDEDKVYFVGYNKFNDKISMWQYEARTTTLVSVDQVIPEAANMEPVEIEIREDQVDDGDLNDTPDFPSGLLGTGTNEAE